MMNHWKSIRRLFFFLMLLNIDSTSGFVWKFLKLFQWILSLEILCEFWLAKSTGLQDEEESLSFFLAYQTPGIVPTLSHPSL